MRAFMTLLVLLGASATTSSAFLLPAASTPPRRGPFSSSRQAATATATGGAPLPLLHQLKSAYPKVPIPADFLAGVQPSDTAPTASATTSNGDDGYSPAEERALLRARTFASLAPRALLARGLDTISEDFVFYSPSTGHLSRAEYMGLLSALERASPDLRLEAAYFRPLAVGGGGGAVSFVSRAQGTLSGELVLGDMRAAGKGAKYVGDVELSVVAFNEDGLLQTLSTGVVVPEAAVAADGELRAALSEGGLEAKGAEEAAAGDEAVLEMRRRLESQTQKLGATPEGTMAWEKIAADVAAIQKKLDAVQLEGDLARSAGGHGGLGGILFALGVEQPQGVLPVVEGRWMAADDMDDVEVAMDFSTIPSECWDHTMLEETTRRQQQQNQGELMSSG